jgi:DNA-binding GntR family transcriptional regulator
MAQIDLSEGSMMAESDLKIAKNRATLRSLIADRLRGAIATGRFLPGQRLVERELCEMLDVSRTSVREAIRQLEAEGIVTNFPHRGPVVSSLDPEEVAELYRMRELLEGYCGNQFAKNGTDAEISKLVEAAERFFEAAKSGDSERLISVKTDFYECLMSGGRNRFVREALVRLHNQITFLRMTSMNRSGRLEDSMSEIERIVAAISRRDPAAAEKACRNHIRSASESVLTALRSVGTEGGD